MRLCAPSARGSETRSPPTPAPGFPAAPAASPRLFSARSRSGRCRCRHRRCQRCSGEIRTSCHLRLPFGCRLLLPQQSDDFCRELAGVVERGGHVADGVRIQAGEWAAEGKNGAERIAFIERCVEHRNALLEHICLQAFKGPGPDGLVRLGEQHGIGNRPPENPLLHPDEFDDFDGLDAVELGAFGRDDSKVGAAHGERHHVRRGAFQIDNDECRLARSCVDFVRQRRFSRAADDGQLLRTSGFTAPAGDRLIGVGVDDRDRRPLPREFGGKQQGGSGFAGAPFGAGEGDGWHWRNPNRLLPSRK